MLRQAGFLGTGATFGADLALIAEIVFFLALCVGVVVQRQRRYRLHDWIQTPVVVLNFFFIIFIMVASFWEQRVVGTLSERPSDPYYLIVAIHAVLGLAAAGLGLYCLLAGHKILPRRIGRLRSWMWATFAVWTAAVLTGVATYTIWYLRGPTATVAAAPETAELIADSGEPAVPGQPAGQQVLLQNFAFNPTQLTLVAGTAVTWLNQDGVPHNVTFVDGSSASDNFFQGESFSATFDAPGVYAIYCSLHGNADGSGMAATVNVVEASEENVTVVAAAPTPDPAPPTPTAAPTVPPAPVALIEPVTQEQAVVGIVSFFDDTAPSDGILVSLSGLPAPVANSDLQAWLVDSRSGQRLDLGLITPDANGNVFRRIIDEQHQNLMAFYDSFEVTEEPQFDDDPSPGPVLYSGQLPGEAMAIIRTITVAAADTPATQPYGIGARRQTEELIRHVEYVQLAFELLSIADAQRHAEHVANLLEGEQGAAFGDLDGAHGVQNPGDGFGIIPYVAGMQVAAVQAQDAADATDAIQIHARHVELATGNALAWATTVRQAGLEILSAQSVGDIGPQVEVLNRYSRLLLDGEDGNGDGVIAPEEGGIFTAYQHAQYMAAIGVLKK
ncbi:MAG TPA: DUF420 domain-containing protein [Anaerolineae bacterium]